MVWPYWFLSRRYLKLPWETNASREIAYILGIRVERTIDTFLLYTYKVMYFFERLIERVSAGGRMRINSKYELRWLKAHRGPRVQVTDVISFDTSRIIALENNGDIIYPISKLFVLCMTRDKSKNRFKISLWRLTIVPMLILVIVEKFTEVMRVEDAWHGNSTL